MQYRTIKSLAQYKSYESYLEKLTWIKDKSVSEKESVECLISLIRKWDADHGTISAFLPNTQCKDPVERLISFMKKNNMRPSDLATVVHMSQSSISNILNYKKELTNDVISKLSEQLGIPPLV